MGYLWDSFGKRLLSYFCCSIRISLTISRIASVSLSAELCWESLSELELVLESSSDLYEDYEDSSELLVSEESDSESEDDISLGSRLS